MASITTGGIPEFLSGGHVARNKTAEVTMGGHIAGTARIESWGV